MRRDILAILFVGVPIAWIGFSLISGRRSDKAKSGLLIAWSVGGMFSCYLWPYLICPIDLPPSAHNLYVSEQGAWLAHHCEVRFDATVEDCIATADRVKVRFADEFDRELQEPFRIDRERGVVPPSDLVVSRRKWWLTTNSIRNGLYYPGGGSSEPEVWVDTDRGVFYFRVTD